jgi:hypothetical protein
MLDWSHPLPEDQPVLLVTLGVYEKTLRDFRDDVMVQYQIAGKSSDPIAGLAEDALGTLADTLSDAITKLSEDSEQIAIEARVGKS